MKTLSAPIFNNLDISFNVFIPPPTVIGMKIDEVISFIKLNRLDLDHTCSQIVYY